MTYEHSCGGVICTRRNGKLYYVIVRSFSGEYGFPKGHMEPGETEVETALREIREETGLRPTLFDGFRVEDSYSLPNKDDVLKRVTYFAGEYENQNIVHQRSELMGARLMTYEEAVGAFRFENPRRILAQADTFLRETLFGKKK